MYPASRKNDLGRRQSFFQVFHLHEELKFEKAYGRAEAEGQARRIRVDAIEHERRTRAIREAEQAQQLQEAAN